MEKIKKISIPDKSRVIVIGDIHGELDLLKELVQKVHVQRDDRLLFIGDLCEKGPDSSGVVDYIMELSVKSPNVHVLEGNCDTLVDDLMELNPDLIGYLNRREKSLFHEWMIKEDMTFSEGTGIEEMKNVLVNSFSKQIEWLSGLPTAIESERYLFVHAGIDPGEEWHETSRMEALTKRAFMEGSHCAGKQVIVGHWPVVNYIENGFSHAPLINHDKKMISIDGGCAVKSSGQLNALIIESGAYSFMYVDHLPDFEVQGDYMPHNQEAAGITFPDYEIERLEVAEDFSRCMHKKTEGMFWVKNEYIEDDGHNVKDDVSCTLLPVTSGERVQLVDGGCTGFDLVKKEGRVGWIPKGLLK
ncbi:metallophosphoesterase family protein [Rossellomorea marisflavi]|uniref:metallophosphoesterase family protein n=1 Tax=Rossellomorea marisflavi TaxID=189381 RepID=UPI00345A2E9E